MIRELEEKNLRCLSFYQLELFIKANDCVDQCKREWRRRTGRNYPRMPFDKEPDEIDVVASGTGQMELFI